MCSQMSLLFARDMLLLAVAACLLVALKQKSEARTLALGHETCDCRNKFNGFLGNGNGGRFGFTGATPKPGSVNTSFSTCYIGAESEANGK